MSPKTQLRLLFAIFIIIMVIVCVEQGTHLTHSDEPTASQSRQTSLSSDETGSITKRPSTRTNETATSHAHWQVGTPGAIIPYPRGKNERRRYGEPKMRELPANLLKRTPAAIAQLPADGRTRLFKHEKDLHTLRAKRLVLNTEALDRVIRAETSRLIVPTTGNDSIEVHIQSIKSRSQQTHTLIGKIAGEKWSEAQFVYHDGIIHGNVTRYLEGEHYEYRILADGYMMVRELDHDSMTAVCGNPDACDHQDHHDAQHHIEEELSDAGIEFHTQESQQGSVVEDTSGWTTVDVVVGYGQQARIEQGGVTQIEALIIDAIDRMNTAFSNSQITNTEMMLLGTIEDPDYVFPGSSSGSMSTGDELGNLNNTTDGILDAVSDYASQLGADFKTFIVKQADGSAGIAYRPGSTSIVARTYVTTTRLTFAHELGHNLGCDHSWGDSSQSYHAHYGWRLDPDGSTSTTSDRRRTIMAYDWNWGGGIRIPYFANPAVNFGSAPTGAVLGYNATGDLYADQRYVTGGLGYSGSNSSLSGFDGTNSTLGARNYLTILTGQGVSNYGAGYASNRSSRASFSVPSPAANSEYAKESTLDIFFIGGDYEYTATVELYKGGVFNTTIASGINPATDRNVSWTIPSTQAGGTDYMVRVTLSHPSYSDVFSDSGQFSILSSNPRVISHSPSPTPTASNLSQFTFTFSKAMNPSTFSTADDIVSFTGPSGIDLTSAITGSSWGNNNTELTVNFSSQSTAGYYRMAIGPQILDPDNNAMDQDGDGVLGENSEDTYAAVAGISSGGGGTTTIWSDLVGTDDLDAGWTFSGGSWATGTANETPTAGPDAGQDGGPILAQNLSGDYNNGEESHAETPVIDCSSYSSITLSYARWAAAGKNDTLYIDAWDGSTWQRVFSISGTPNGNSNDTNWTIHSPSLAGYADGNASFKLRWGLIDVTRGGSGRETGWQIDAIQISGSVPPNPLPAPRIINHSPSGTASGSQSAAYVEFSNPMDTGGFSLADIASFTGPSGNITASGYSWISDTLLRIDFPSQSTAGAYSLVLNPTIPDTSGFNLDQDNDGNAGEASEDQYTLGFNITNFQALYDTWASSGFSQTFINTGVSQNDDWDDLINLMEYAFGTDPTSSAIPDISYVEGGDVTTPGHPILVNAGTPSSPAYRAVFGRRKDYIAAGLTYTVELCADLSNWTSVSTTPIRLTSETSSGDIEAVYVPFPATIMVEGNAVVPKYFRVMVSN